MNRKSRLLSACAVAIGLTAAISFAIAEEKKAADPKISADQAKAAFAAKFADYKAAITDIEKLQAEFQSADAAKREKLNATMAAQVTHAQSLVNAMLDAGEAAYRAAPNTDPEVTNLLFTVAKYYTIGRQIGPGVPGQRNPDDIYYPIDGGDQYERALPIMKLLIDGGAPEKELYVYGFLCAYMTNDYDLAKTYLAKVKETNALQSISDIVQRGDKVEPQAGLMKTVLHTVSVCFS